MFDQEHPMRESLIEALQSGRAVIQQQTMHCDGPGYDNYGAARLEFVVVVYASMTDEMNITFEGEPSTNTGKQVSNEEAVEFLKRKVLINAGKKTKKA
jgi:hypothetical protein